MGIYHTPIEMNSSKWSFHVTLQLSGVTFSAQWITNQSETMSEKEDEWKSERQHKNGGMLHPPVASFSLPANPADSLST